MDLHRCGDCQKEFNSYENFLIHKLLIEEYKLTIEPSERITGLRLPKFIKAQSKSSVTTENNDSVIPSLSAIADSNMASVTDDTDSLTNPSVSDVNDDQMIIECTVKNGTRTPPLNGTECDSNVIQNPDIESDDNVSVWSQTESLRIDESATVKDTLPSPLDEGSSGLELKQNCQVYCKHCKRYYKNKVVLRVHEETVHRSDRPHSCAICQQTFKTKGSLIRHARTHTGERPFRCIECGRAFHDSGSLCRHIHRLHRNLPTKQERNDVQVLITRLVTQTESQPPLAESETT